MFVTEGISAGILDYTAYIAVDKMRSRCFLISIKKLQVISKTGMHIFYKNLGTTSKL
jgi:hypothetical protein